VCFRRTKVLRARGGDSPTLEEMRRSLASIFVHKPHHSRSERYVYISTEDVAGLEADALQ